MKTYIKKASRGEDLSFNQAKDAMNQIMQAKATPSQMAALLIALKIKGESSEEIAAFVSEMNKHAIPVKPKTKKVLVDVCGTGGDGHQTFNISTCSMFVAAAAGVVIAKHGNRSLTSHCGSADILESLGAPINLVPESIEKCIDEVGIGFMFAPLHHPAMKHVMPTRKEIGVRTVFNILGPLVNPANTQIQVMGVFDENLTEKLCKVFKLLGKKTAYVVCGKPGLDEYSTVGVTKVSRLCGGQVDTYEFNPQELGIPLTRLTDIQSRDAQENKKIVLDVLGGRADEAKTNIVALNAAAAIKAAQIKDSMAEAYDLAHKTIDSGESKKKLDEFIEFTKNI
ncbi:MAG: anthranilate phosphoribosyltransferase [Candidatus Altiarchaeales archaeon]|nr:anthranilate phosphoribosyltransferase [Candidatus Altiarchaeales archaeon]